MKITDYTDKKVLDSIKVFESISMMWDNSLSLYGDNIAIQEDAKTYTYKQLNEAIISFRGYLYDLGYKEGKNIKIVSSCTFGFVKAFLAAETLGLCVTVLPEKEVDGALLPSEYSLEKKGSKTSSFYPTKEDKAVIMFTGGTTGVPKEAIISNRSIMTSLYNACLGYSNVFGQKYLHVLPMHHVFGLIRSMLTCLYTGGTLILCKNPSSMFEVAIKENPNISVLVPLLVQRGLEVSKKINKNAFGNSMKTIITGAAPVAQNLAKACKDLNITLCPGYGLTETSCLVSGNPDILNHPGSVGLCYPFQKVRIVDKEIQIKGDNLFSGYVNSDIDAFTNDGWFKSGDYGYLDEDSFLYILGRKKEMLLTANGENVFPSQVEAEFKTLVEVNECELFVGEDASLHLEVYPNEVDKYKTCKEEENKLLLKLSKINDGLEKYQKASKITLRYTDFPRTKSLKIIRRG